MRERLGGGPNGKTEKTKKPPVHQRNGDEAKRKSRLNRDYEEGHGPRRRAINNR